MRLITDKLLVGNVEDALHPPPTIDTLLLVAEEYMVEPARFADYHRIPMKEFAEPDPVVLMRAVAWLEKRVPKGPVMVCCRAGLGRSVSVVMAYLCCVEGMPYAEALKLIMVRRPGAMPLPNLEEAIEQVRLSRRAA